MCRDQFGEFVCGYWCLMGKYRHFLWPPQCLHEQSLTVLIINSSEICVKFTSVFHHELQGNPLKCTEQSFLVAGILDLFHAAQFLSCFQALKKSSILTSFFTTHLPEALRGNRKLVERYF